MSHLARYVQCEGASEDQRQPSIKRIEVILHPRMRGLQCRTRVGSAGLRAAGVTSVVQAASSARCKRQAKWVRAGDICSNYPYRVPVLRGSASIVHCDALTSPSCMLVCRVIEFQPCGSCTYGNNSTEVKQAAAERHLCRCSLRCQWQCQSCPHMRLLHPAELVIFAQSYD